MKDKTLKIIFAPLSLIVLTALIFKLRNIPGGMILSGLALGGMFIIGILLGSCAIAALIRIILKKYSFLTLYSILTFIAFSYFYYSLYSPTLKIIVPQGYKGEVTLVLSNVKDNILTLDTNGIGYINQWTFDHTYTTPLVVDTKGNRINDLCVGFDPKVFWGKGNSCCVSGKEIETLSFEIISKEKNSTKQYNTKDIITLVNKNLVNFTNGDGPTTIDNVSIKK